MGYYAYGLCTSSNDLNMGAGVLTTPNQTLTNTLGNGTLAPATVTGLSPDTLYCVETCVVDLTVDPNIAVCGNTQTFMWTSPVSKSERDARRVGNVARVALGWS